MKSSNSHRVPDGLIHIGTVIGVHGLRGAVKVYSFAESGEHYGPRRDLVLMDEAGICRPFKIAASQPHKNTWRISLADVVTREDAEGLIGCAVLIHRSHLPALDEDTFYWADLLGMAVITGSDEYLGRITDIIPTGANDVYVVSADAGDSATGTDGADAGGAPREILIPALASVVLAVDTDRRTMTVELPEGLDA